MLREAVRTNDDVPERDRTEPLTEAEFEELLTTVFGQKFTSLDAPTDSQVTRRIWNPDAKTGGQRSQCEQRIVDVTLRDILAITFALPDEAKQPWLTVLDGLTLKTGWQQFADQIDQLGLETTPQSGYFWSALLAALSSITPHITLAEFHPGHPGGEHVGDAICRVIAKGEAPGGQGVRGYDVFGVCCTPRETGQKPITETAHAEAVRIGAKLIAQAADLAAALDVTQSEFLLLAQIVGAAVSADLWHQPASVRYLLIAAAAGLRSVAECHSMNVGFSLDGQTPDTAGSNKKKADENKPTTANGQIGTVEYLIAEELGMRWRIRQHWGPREPHHDQG